MEDTDTSGIDDDEEYEDLVDDNNFEDDDDDDINDDEIQVNTSDSDDYHDIIDTSITHMEDENDSDDDDDDNENQDEPLQTISSRDLGSIINQLLHQRNYLHRNEDHNQDEHQDNRDYDNQEEEEEEGEEEEEEEYGEEEDEDDDDDDDDDLNGYRGRFNLLNPIFLNLLGQNSLLRPRDTSNNNNNSNSNRNNNNDNNNNDINQVIEPIEGQTINLQLQIRLRDQKTNLNRFLLNRELSDKNNENIRISQHYLPMNRAETVISMPSRIFCCKITSDGKRLMTASQDKMIRIFNTSNFEQIKEIQAVDINWSIIDTDYSPDQNWLIYSSWSHYIQLCRVNFNENNQYDTDFSRRKTTNSSTTIRGGIKPTFEDYNESLFLDPNNFDRFCVFGLKFSPNNKEILCGCSNGEIIIYDLEGRQVINHFRGHGRDVNSVCYLDHTGNIFVTGSDDSLIRVWDKRSLDNSGSSSGGDSNKPVGTFTGHYQGLTHVCSKDDGTYVLSNSKDQTAKLWDIRKMSNPTSKPPSGGVNWDYRYYSYPSDYVMPNPLRNGSNSKDVSLMSYRGHQVVQTLIRCYFSPIETTAQKYIYSGSFNGIIYIYDVLTGKLVKTLTDIPQNNSQSNYQNNPQRLHLIRDLAWSPNSLNLISGNWDGRVTSWSNFYDHRYDDWECRSLGGIKIAWIINMHYEIPIFVSFIFLKC
ncbi:hypothetical protein ACTFIW_000218 [Dictyostelium discoideum]